MVNFAHHPAKRRGPRPGGSRLSEWQFSTPVQPSLGAAGGVGCGADEAFPDPEAERPGTGSKAVLGWRNLWSRSFGQALRTATPEVRLTINQLDSIIRKRYGEHCADRRLARTRVMQQRARVLAALTAIVCAAFVGCNACAQLYNNEYTCVAGRSCCVGWPNSPD